MTTQEAGWPADEQVSEAVDILKLIADPTRLRILWALLHGEHSVNLLAEHVGAQPSAVSQHLAKLRLGHLVCTRREGTKVFYLAQNDHVRRIVEAALFRADHVLQGLADHDQGRSPQRVKQTAKPA
ncbi:MAG: metalloregulator ArsR/SmtB family transcription factor [Actinomycetota bacterium]|nr:metalloregulator ArsR/SmtB family transcription factor [Actinomycetota bacterium]